MAKRLRSVASALSIGSSMVSGCLVLVVVLYLVSVAWWSLIIWLGAVQIGHAETWSYWWVATHWGLLAPCVLG